MNRSMPSLVSTFCALFFGAANIMAESKPMEVSVTARVRDFKEISPSDTAGAHPHFNNQNGCSSQELGVFSVQPTLQINGESRTPKLMDSLPPTLAKCYAPKERFSEWFTDKPGINRSFLVDMRFQWNEGKGTYQFGDRTFFPIDDGNAFVPVIPGETTYGHLQTGIMDGVDVSKHNYGFTMEMHTMFAYQEGKGQMVSIQGDDDIWLFLNGIRVVDLGGVHQLQTASVNLDSAKAALGLENGMNYTFDFYFAERHTASSSCTITTNLAIGTPVEAAAVRSKANFKVAAVSGPVAIYDRSGRLVRTIQSSNLESVSLAWDHKDAEGRLAAPGIYFWRAAGAGRGTAVPAVPMAAGKVVIR